MRLTFEPLPNDTITVTLRADNEAERTFLNLMRDSWQLSCDKTDLEAIAVIFKPVAEDGDG